MEFFLDEGHFIAKGKDSEFICKCGAIVTEGYHCDQKGTICMDCQSKDTMSRCIHDANGEHKHIKFIRIK